MYKQQWSKVKKRLESYLCDSLKGRVDFHVTNYRKAHDQMGRAFITVDKKEVLNMCTIKAETALIKKERELRDSKNISYSAFNIEQNGEISGQAHKILIKEGIFAQYDFFEAAEEYFNSPIEKSLKSNNMIIKIFSILDRRIGKRTLVNLKELMNTEHELIQYFYKLRCEAEGI